MAGLIPEGTIAQILEHSDIVDVVSHYFPLKRAGQGFTALCPFHNEKTPSFHVSPQRQCYHCFGCGKGGNAIGFVMEMEKVPFPEAVEMLADRCGIQIERQSSGAGSSDKRKLLYDVLKWAAAVFRRNLANEPGEIARSYLQKRGISDESIEQFGLGYSMPGWDDIILKAKKANAPIKGLEGAGLIISRNSGSGHFDRFRNRLMFPIGNAQGKIVGFGARALDPNEDAKYLNSPETPLFAKSKLLYGLTQARNSIFRSQSVVVVEGYTDVIMAHQFGFTNVVATLGTALGRDHIRQLKRYADQCTLVFDGDAAGQKASDGSLQTFVEEGLKVQVATLPSGKDPCDCLLDYGAEIFQDCLNNACGIYEFKLRSAGNGALNDPKESARVVDDALSLVLRVQNVVERRLQLDNVAMLLHTRLGVPEESVRKRFMQLSRSQNKRTSRNEPEIPIRAQRPPMPPAEKEMVTVCVQEPSLFAQLMDYVGPEDFTNADLRSIMQAAYDLVQSEGRVEPAWLSARLVQPEQASLLAQLQNSNDGGTNFEERLASCLETFERQKVKKQIEQIKQQMLSAAREGDIESSQRLQQEYARLKQMSQGA